MYKTSEKIMNIYARYGVYTIVMPHPKRRHCYKKMMTERKKNYICQIMSRQNYVNNLW